MCDMFKDLGHIHQIAQSCLEVQCDNAWEKYTKSRYEHIYLLFFYLVSHDLYDANIWDLEKEIHHFSHRRHRIHKMP